MRLSVVSHYTQPDGNASRKTRNIILGTRRPCTYVTSVRARAFATFQFDFSVYNINTTEYFTNMYRTSRIIGARAGVYFIVVRSLMMGLTARPGDNKKRITKVVGSMYSVVLALSPIRNPTNSKRVPYKFNASHTTCFIIIIIIIIVGIITIITHKIYIRVV